MRPGAILLLVIQQAWGQAVSVTIPPTDLTSKVTGLLPLANGGNNCAAPYAVNPQTTTYQALAADFTCFKTISVASGTFTITLVASTSQPAAGTWIKIINYGSGTVTISRSGQNINGGTTSLTLQPATSAQLPSQAFMISDGTNYFAAMYFANPGFTGTGSIVQATSPTLVTPALGTPASGVMTNMTGLVNAGIVNSTIDLTAKVTNTLPTANGGTGCATTLFGINPQTATYQAVAADFSCYKTITVASGTFTITLVANTSQPANGQFIHIINYGSGVVTIARSGQNLNGGTTSLTISAGSATAPLDAFVRSDGTNYFISK